MPFQNHGTRAFTTTSIRKNAPAQSGIYGISSADEWIYIGESNNIQARLLDHLQEIGSLLQARHPTGFTFEICQPADRATRQDSLVRELEPVCNRRLAVTTA